MVCWGSGHGCGVGSTKLSPERQKQLESLPGWYWGTSGDYAWEQKLAVLKKSLIGKGTHGFPSVKGDQVKVGTWAAQQRSERRTLSPERVASLDALPGWTAVSTTPGMIGTPRCAHLQPEKVTHGLSKALGARSGSASGSQFSG
jgi:hypothetical protein